jgi:hypothetical protein
VYRRGKRYRTIPGRRNDFGVDGPLALRHHSTVLIHVSDADDEMIEKLVAKYLVL